MSVWSFGAPLSLPLDLQVLGPRCKIFGCPLLVKAASRGLKNYQYNGSGPYMATVSCILNIP